MPSINVSKETKDEFDSRQDDSQSQDEFAQELLQAHELLEAADKPSIDIDELTEMIARKVAPRVEMAAHRGCMDYHD